MQDSVLFPTYNPISISFTHGKGSTLYDANGKKYIDFCAGLAVSSLGYSNKKVIDALKAAADKVWHTSNAFTITESRELAKKLTNITFADKVFFANSGAEAMECAIKTIRMFYYKKFGKRKNNIVSFLGGFHGRTNAMLAVGSPDKFNPGFSPVLDGFKHAKINDNQSVLDIIDDNTAGIVIEPIQGHAGIIPVDVKFLQFLRNICDDKGIVLCFDEIQCGSGRVGKFLASEIYGVTPDITAIAKGIGAGFPIAACLAKNIFADVMSVGLHGSTYGGNPLAANVSSVVIDEIMDNLDNVVEASNIIMDYLLNLKEKIPNVILDVRGCGLMIGVELSSKFNNKIVTKLLCANGLLVSVAENSVLRITPPLVITKKEIYEGLNILDSILSAL